MTSSLTTKFFWTGVSVKQKKGLVESPCTRWMMGKTSFQKFWRHFRTLFYRRKKATLFFKLWESVPKSENSFSSRVTLCYDFKFREICLKCVSVHSHCPINGTPDRSVKWILIYSHVGTMSVLTLTCQIPQKFFGLTCPPSQTIFLHFLPRESERFIWSTIVNCSMGSRPEWCLSHQQPTR